MNLEKETNGGDNSEAESKSVHEVKYISNGVDTSEAQKLQPEGGVRKSDSLFLYFTVLIGTLPLLVGGTSGVWMSPVLPILQSNDTNINPLEKPITTVETSILAALPVLIGLVGCLIMPKLADFMGRKYFLLTMGMGMLFTYLGKAFSHHTIYLIIHRCAFTTFLNAVAVVLQVYISEVCEDHNRAKYMCLKSLFLPLGNLYAYTVGPYLNFRDFNIVCALPLVPFLVLFLLVPESPIYSLSKGNTECCKNALKRLRSNKDIKELDIEFKKIDQTLKMLRSTTAVTCFSLFETKEVRVAVKLTIFLSILEFSSGVAIIASFLEPLLHEAGTSYSVDTMAVIVGVTQVLSLVLTSVVVEKTGRRVLLILSGIGCCVSLFLFGVFYYLKANNSPILHYIEWLPIVCIVAYFLIFSTGLGPLPITVITELFPSGLTTVALSFAVTAMSVTVFLLIFIYPILLEYIGVHWCMWIYSGFCLGGAGLVYKILPETRGKSSMEIQEMLKQY